MVHSAFVRFPGLLYELGLSAQPNQILSIKLEVETNSPAGAILETTVVRRHVILRLQHHDRASLLARGAKIGITTSVRKHDWQAAGIYLNKRSMVYTMSDDQMGKLLAFGS